jgi:glutamate synthase (NADPH/NADH) large chain/glutamate synthase (ferredoxin)
LPVVRQGGSDTAVFDNVLELLVLAGRSLPHALMMMVPEAHAGRPDVPDELRGFYAFHDCLTEAWDGPAAIAFTDGRLIGATLDRNGLRPGRWLETRDGWVVLASEAGVLDIPASRSCARGRLAARQALRRRPRPGTHRPRRRGEAEVATRKPYAAWFEREHVRLADLPRPAPRVAAEPLRSLQLAFGYTQEDMKVMLAPLAVNGEEAIGSMGNDTPLAALSGPAPLLYSYFKQLFAQVTNPPIDSTREAIVMSVQSLVGSERNLLAETPEHARQLVIDNPILRDDELESLRRSSRTSSTHTPRHDVAGRGRRRRPRAGARASSAPTPTRRSPAAPTSSSSRIARWGRSARRSPRCSPVGAVHHHLVRAGTRLQAGLVVESGEPRSVQSVAVLIGYGAAAVNPYLMLGTIGQLVDEGRIDLSRDEAVTRAIKAVGKGLLKVISKMGISTISSYCGAQVFEAVGLSTALVERYFTGTPSRIGGIGLDEIAEGVLVRHARAYPGARGELLPVVGLYAWRRDGEHHQWNPETIALLQHAVRGGGQQTYDEFAATVNADSARRSTLRGLLRFRADRAPIALDDVEPRPRSSSASRPAPCRSARCRARRTRRSPSP